MVSKSGDLVVRRLSVDDLEHFQTIRLEALRMEPDAFASSVEDYAAMPAEAWRDLLRDHAIFAAFSGAEPVGMMALIRERLVRCMHRAHVSMVYSRRDCRGAGVGTSLFSTLLRHAEDTGIRQLELQVSAENPDASRFYEKMGFREAGRIPSGFIHEGRSIDTLILVRAIG